MADPASDLMHTFAAELMLLAAVTDTAEHRIPNGIVCTGIAVCLGQLVCALQEGIPAAEEAARLLAGMAAGGGIFALAHILTDRGIGAGDVKYFSVMGMIYGWRHALRLTGLTLLLVTVYIIAGLAAGRLDRKTGIALAPFALAAEMLLTASGM